MIRSLILGCLTVLAATLVAYSASASSRSPQFVETLHPSTVVLDWTTDADSLQAVLHEALAELALNEPSADSSLVRLENGELRLEEPGNRISCEARTRGMIQVMSYRCEFDLSTPVSEWTSDSRAVSSVLYRAFTALRQSRGDSLLTLSFRERDGLLNVRLADNTSGSRILCQKDILGLAGSVRCRIDLRP